MIQQKLEAQIPILTEVIRSRIKDQNPVVNQLEGEEHTGVACSACQAEPIKGIRYKCPECIVFNLCSVCEQKIDHDHDLLKMKKPREEVDFDGKEEREKKLMKCAKKFVKICNRSSSKDSSRSRDKCRGWRKRKHHHPWRRGEILENTNENEGDMTVSRPFLPPHFPHPPYGYNWNHPHGPPPPTAYGISSEIKKSSVKEEKPVKK